MVELVVELAVDLGRLLVEAVERTVVPASDAEQAAPTEAATTSAATVIRRRRAVPIRVRNGRLLTGRSWRATHTPTRHRKGRTSFVRAVTRLLGARCRDRMIRPMGREALTRSATAPAPARRVERVIRDTIVGVVVTAVALTASVAPAAASTSNAGDLGNMPWIVYLLIPTVIVFALLTAFVLGDRAEPPPVHRREGRVTRALDERSSEPAAPAPPSS